MHVLYSETDVCLCSLYVLTGSCIISFPLKLIAICCEWIRLSGDGYPAVVLVLLATVVVMVAVSQDGKNFGGQLIPLVVFASVLGRW